MRASCSAQSARICLCVLLLLCVIWVSGCAGEESGNDQPAARPTPATVAGEEPVSAPTVATVSPLAVPLTGATATDVADSANTHAATLPDSPPIRYTYEVVATFPHDANAFTQGLLFDGDILYEGTGLYGESSLRRVELATGTVEQQIALPEQYFGEGIALIGDRIFQLTWREQTGFIFDKISFEQIGQFTYQTEGWGLTYDGSNLILSDGSDQLYTIDPTSMAVTDQVSVTYFDGADQQRKPLVRLNELEFINGEIFANIWQTNFIVRITPETGNVTGIIDLSGLLPAEDYTASTDVLNGIAYHPATDQLYVTGKKWPKLFEIRLIAEQ
ncbi:MAG: glutaminyl-peptide cyclotransferase [Caldilineaceae bacterium]|nr:glutaminyl-peptide cyclotransferase [Caldilineaceae bacterium]